MKTLHSQPSEWVAKSFFGRSRILWGFRKIRKNKTRRGPLKLALALWRMMARFGKFQEANIVPERRITEEAGVKRRGVVRRNNW